MHLKIEQLHSRSSAQPLVEVVCPLSEVSRTLVACVENLLRRHGIVGYRAKWHEGELPLAQYLMLKRWLESPDYDPTKASTGTWPEDIETLRSLGC